MTWRIADADERHCLVPLGLTTVGYGVPSQRMREALSAGNVCRLLFVREDLSEVATDLQNTYAIHRKIGRAEGPRHAVTCAGESMWVRILERREHPIAGKRVRIEYIGELASDPTVFAGTLRYGERLTFSPDHVVAWEPFG